MDVETSLNHTRAIDTNNRLYCFGATTKDFLGTSSDGNSPQEVDASLRFIDVAGGYDHTCAIRTDGQAMCFGVTNNPACGTGASPNDCDIPTLVQGGHQFTEIDAGTQTNCAIEQGTNLLYCWGLYFHENPSDATDANLQSTSAIKIHAGTSYDKVFAGRNHLCARNMDDHALYCIGTTRLRNWGQELVFITQPRPECWGTISS